jgi:hypothetical protein
MEESELNEIIDWLTAGQVFDDARILMLQDVVLAIAQKTGIESFEGKPIVQWMSEKRQERLREQTFLMEDFSPEQAARIQNALNRAQAMADEAARKKREGK